jgi:pilus assembly protein CpaB
MAKKKKAAPSGGASSGPIRALVFAGVALVAGALALLFLGNMIRGYQAQIDEAKKPEDTVMVIVAARDLYQGVTITEEDLYMVDIPPRYLPENVFLSPEHVVGRIPRERILANEFIRADRLADPESGAGLNAVIPRGMRAISVNISDGRALSGFLNPGNYVDVLVTIKPDDQDEKPVTNTIMQAIFVLGVNSRKGQESDEDARQKRGKQRPTVTLLVTAEEAESVAFAEALGDITLALRNDLDIAFAETTGVDVVDLRAKLEKPKPVRSRARKKSTADDGGSVLFIKGDERSKVKTDASGNTVKRK